MTYFVRQFVDVILEPIQNEDFDLQPLVRCPKGATVEKWSMLVFIDTNLAA